jgi:hypothetical protein
VLPELLIGSNKEVNETHYRLAYAGQKSGVGSFQQMAYYSRGEAALHCPLRVLVLREW